jgi:hypothetical protein
MKTAGMTHKQLRDALCTEHSLRLQAEADCARLLVMYDSKRGEVKALQERCNRMKDASPEIWAQFFSKAAIREVA